MPVDTDPGPPEERTLDSVVLSGRSGKKGLKMFGVKQIWILFLWKRQRRRTYLQRPQSASWLLPTVWLPERRCVFQRGRAEFPFPSARPGNLKPMKRGDHCN